MLFSMTLCILHAGLESLETLVVEAFLLTLLPAPSPGISS